MPLVDVDIVAPTIDGGTGFVQAPGVDLSAYRPENLRVTFPGGAVLEATSVAPEKVADALIAQVNTVLAPFTPIFDIIDTVLLLKDTLEGLATLNPIKISSVVPKFVAQVNKFLSMVPQLSFPKMVADIVDLLIAYLTVLRIKLTALSRFKARIAAAQARAVVIQDVRLTAMVDASNGQLAVQMTLATSNAPPLNRLIRIVNILGGIVGLPQVPSLDSLGSDPDAAITALDSALNALRTVRSLIPL